MKNLNSCVFLIVILFLLVVSCKKDSTAGIKPGLYPSKTTVKIGEPFLITTSVEASNTIVKWSTGPNGQVWTSGSSDSATFIFTSPGTFGITATYYNNATGTNPSMPYDSSNITITVSDSIYRDTTSIHCNVIALNPISSGDQIHLTPISYSDTGLIFLANTQMLYNISSWLNCGGNITDTGGIYEYDFNTVFIYPCLQIYNPPVPAVGALSFTSLTNGTYNLVLKLNGTIYQGSFTATDANCSITWNYTTGITISPLTIQKTIL